MALFIIALIIFVIADIIIRYGFRNYREKKVRKQREETLQVSLNLDFSKEATTLKRVEVDKPKARILCVDDEPVILDSFRKILVLDGYSVDTVEKGQDALNLIRTRHYDFVFTDLKMPEMSGVDVAKAVKHLRPDIDVIIITGFATIETAVEVMKFGAMDYVQKPFTEDELLDFTGKSLIKRKERISKSLRPQVYISHLSESEYFEPGQFSIPGGIFIAENHCWVSVSEDGTAKIGIDDFAKKIFGEIDSVEMPNLSMNVAKGQLLFTINKGGRKIACNSPISGVVTKINTDLAENLDKLNITPYEKNWFCVLDAQNLHEELEKLKIGKSAVELYETDLETCKKFIESKLSTENETKNKEKSVIVDEVQHLDNVEWESVADKFFKRN